MGQIDRYRYEPKDAQQASEMAKWIHASKLAPRGLKPNDIFLVMATGAEYGWSTMLSLRSLYVIDGRVCMYADAIVGLVKSAAECLYFRLVSSTNNEAIFETHRVGSPEPECMRFAKEDATMAGLWGRPGPWSKYPADMLRARCKVRLARDVYPDVVGGIYDPDELTEALDVPTATVVDEAEAVVLEVEGCATHHVVKQQDPVEPPPSFDELSSNWMGVIHSMDAEDDDVLDPRDAGRRVVVELVSSGYAADEKEASRRLNVCIRKHRPEGKELTLRHIALASAQVEFDVMCHRMESSP